MKRGVVVQVGEGERREVEISLSEGEHDDVCSLALERVDQVVALDRRGLDAGGDSVRDGGDAEPRTWRRGRGRHQTYVTRASSSIRAHSASTSPRFCPSAL